MTTPKTEAPPAHDLTEEGATPDLHRIFAKLRELWIECPEPIPGTDGSRARSSAALADYLGMPKQRITQWATGSGGKAPAPWHVVMKLADELGYGVALHPKKGARLYRLPKDD